ncbi:MAG: peptidylprolyl isomerase [Candidatus Eremiobacteraeota bacterium]|nr:peptidylprolyl isomerase [Candidatus Eremiobacteraeota bacterium]
MSKALRITVGLAGLLMGTVLAACSGGGAVATVNGQPISQATFDSRLEQSPLARTVLQQLVQETLIEQYAKNNNITVTDADIDARETQIKASFPAGTWDEMLRARGLTETDVRSALREQIMLDKALAKDVNITPAQVSAYFKKNHATFDKPEQVTARHILVPTLPQANMIEAKLKAGGNFAALAKQYSTDPGSKDKGGELGSFRRGQMVPAFDKYAFSAPIGQISPPIKSPFGYHIIQVESRTPGQQATLASATPQIMDTLRQQQEAPLIQPFLQGLQQKATIVVNNPQFAGLFPAQQPVASAAPAASAAASSAASPAPAATK